MAINHTEHLAYAKRTSISQPKPAAISGEWMVLSVWIEAIGLTITGPAGWTEVPESKLEETNATLVTYYKKYEGEAGPYAVAWGGVEHGCTSFICSFSGPTTAILNAHSAKKSSGTSTSVEWASMTPSKAGTLLILIAANGEGVHTTPPEGFTEVEQTALFCCEAVDTEAVATGIKVGKLTLAERWMAVGLAISPVEAIPVVTKPENQVNTVGIPIDEVLLSATNTPTEWKQELLPTGLELDPKTGIVSGTPSTAGQSRVVKIWAKNAFGESTKIEFTWKTVSAVNAKTYNGYTAHSPMPPTVKMGSATSPFNVPVAQSRILSTSAEMIKWMMEQVKITPEALTPAGGFPLVFASNADPQVEILPSETWSEQFFTKKKVRIPVATKAQITSDKHLTIVLCPEDCTTLGIPTGSTLQMWRVGGNAWISEEIAGKKPHEESEEVHYTESGKKLECATAAIGNIAKSMQENFGSVAAAFDSYAGTIRAIELRLKEIDHALCIWGYNTKKSFVYPATHSDGEENGLPTAVPAYAPAMGQRFFLEMSEKEIEELSGVPPYLETVLKACAKYGFYIEDNGEPFGWGFRCENDNGYTAFNATDPWQRVAEIEGLAKGPRGWEFPIIAGAMTQKLWEEKLRACVPPIKEGAAQPVITVPKEQSNAANETVALKLESSNVTTFESSTLPPGLAINETTGEITGKPTTKGTYHVVIYGKGQETEIEARFTWNITTEGGTLPTIAKPANREDTVSKAITGWQISATNAEKYFGTNLPPGTKVAELTGKVTGTPTTTGTYNVTLEVRNATGTATTSFEWKIIAETSPKVTKPADQINTVNVVLSPEVAVEATNTTEWKATGLPTGLVISPTTGKISGTPTALGKFEPTITVKGTGETSTKFKWEIIAAATVTAPANQVTTKEVAISPFTVEATGAVRYELSGNPPGITISELTGVISGASTAAAGEKLVTLKVFNAAGTEASTTFKWKTVLKSTVTSPGKQKSVVGTAITPLVIAATNQTEVKAKNLPAGLSINTSTREITGTPTSAGTVTVTLEAPNSASPPYTATATFSWEVELSTTETIVDPSPYPSTFKIKPQYKGAGGTISYHWTRKMYKVRDHMNAQEEIVGVEDEDLKQALRDMGIFEEIKE